MSRLLGRGVAEVENPRALQAPDIAPGLANEAAGGCVHEALSVDGDELPHVGLDDTVIQERCDACGSTMSPQRVRVLLEEQVAGPNGPPR